MLIVAAVATEKFDGISPRVKKQALLADVVFTKVESLASMSLAYKFVVSPLSPSHAPLLPSPLGYTVVVLI